VWPMMITELYNMKNAHLNQLRNKSKKLSTCIFCCIAVLTSEEDVVTL
jgi:hypothetical protein